MKKVLIIFSYLILIAGIGIGIYMAMNYKGKFEKQVEQTKLVETQLLQKEQEKHQEVTYVKAYKYNADIPAGGLITEDLITEIQVPESVLNSDMMTDITKIPAYSKYSVKSGDIIMNNFLMYDEYYSYKKFTREIMFEAVPLGLRAGDYVDIRMILPNGEIYNVLTHMRVELLSGTTISFRVSEEESMIIDSMYLDQATYNGYLLFYLVRYINPGEDHSLAVYPIPTELEDHLRFNPNITDTTRLINPTLRAHIDQTLMLYSSAQNSDVAGAFIGLLESHYANTLAVHEDYIKDNTDKETGDVTIGGFLTQDGNDGVYNDDAFKEEVNGAISDIEQGILDFEELIQ